MLYNQSKGNLSAHLCTKFQTSSLNDAKDIADIARGGLALGKFDFGKCSFPANTHFRGMIPSENVSMTVKVNQRHVTRVTRRLFRFIPYSSLQRDLVSVDSQVNTELHQALKQIFPSIHLLYPRGRLCLHTECYALSLEFHQGLPIIVTPRFIPTTKLPPHFTE